MSAYRSSLLHGTACIAALLAVTSPASAQSAGSAESIQVTGQAFPGTAAQQAPQGASLTQTEPTSTVSQRFIAEDVPATSNYDDIIRLTPSAMDIDPNGPGLQQDFGQSIRGLQYTQFSVLFDGIQIPGSPGNLSPQPAAYFVAHDLQTITVNRGPGPASTIGSATFGGDVEIHGLDPSTTSQLIPYATFGTFGTKLYGLEADSGTFGHEFGLLAGGRIVIDLERNESRGALTGTSDERRNLYLKYIQPIGDRTTLTAAANLDNAVTDTPYGSSLAEIQEYGRNFSLNDDPRSQAYGPYNRDNYTTDFEYLKLDHSFAHGLAVSDQPYTTAFYHRGVQTTDTSLSTPNLTSSATNSYYINGALVNLNDDVPGAAYKNDYRAWGNILRVTQDTPYGQLRAGAWFESEDNTLYKTNVVLTRDQMAYTTKPTGSIYQYLYFDRLTTVQPYIEFAWHPLKTLTITAGVKYSSVTRHLDGPLVRTIKGPADDHATYNKALPSIDVNERLTPHWSVFFQAAEGYLTPPLNVFYAQILNTVQPSTTDNYQIGTVYQRGWLSADADFYDLQYQNYIAATTIGTNTLYTNQGNATFEGVELEATAQIGLGLALYANGSLNHANYHNGAQVAQAPRRTAVAGLLFDRSHVVLAGDKLDASFLIKDVGQQYGLDTGQKDQFPIKSYDTTDLSVHYLLPLPKHRQLDLGVQVTNLFNNLSLIGYAGAAAGNNAPLYWVNAGRGIFFSVAARI